MRPTSSTCCVGERERELQEGNRRNKGNDGVVD